MHLAYDLDAQALYITLNAETVVRTVPVDDVTNVDLDDDGGLVGVEVLGGGPWPLEGVFAAYEMAPFDTECLRALSAAGWQMPTLTVSNAANW